ncbi:MAG: glycosyltransferase [Bacteroidaceae bacterium]|nr:glycosyltransferase [Bacteroidaceae bacterium]
MATNPTVGVLMSAYNGTAYLEEQLHSIYAQRDVEVRLLVRDDGSASAPLRAALDGEQAAGRLTWYEGPNLGPARSFMHLLRQAPAADCYAFADQDDVWLPEKLATAVERLDGTDGPALYFSQTQLVDAALRPLPNVVIAPRLTLGEALVYQFVGGNTIVMNAAMRDVLLRYDPAYMRMHDIWCYDVALAVGAKVVFDPQPHILYRQHGSNAVGQADSWRFRWRARRQRLTAERHIRSRIARQLLDGYADAMTAEARRLVATAADASSSWRARWRLVTDPAYEPADKAVARSFRIAAMLGLF